MSAAKLDGSEDAPERCLLAELEALPPGSVRAVLARYLQRPARLRDPSAERLLDPASQAALGALPEGSVIEAAVHLDHGQLQLAEWQVRAAPLERLSREGDWSTLTPAKIADLTQRQAIKEATRAFFAARGFLELETPLIVASPGLDRHVEALEVRGMREPAWLITSPEYHMKRALSAGLQKIVQLTKSFRREELGDLHQPEFTMLEWYRAGAEVEAVMRDTEALVRSLAIAFRGEPALSVLGRRVSVETPWPRVSVQEAFARLAGADAFALAREDETEFYRLLIEEVEPQLAQEQATFLVRWPASMASLARLCPDDPQVCERFEAFVGPLELCNGFGELVDAREQRARLLAEDAARRAQGAPIYPIDARFLQALEDGIPPSAGNALGFDRLVMTLLGKLQIQEVLAFPHI